MSILLPASAWAGIAIGLRLARPVLDLRHVWLRATVLWAVALVVMTEALSVAGLVVPSGLGIGWAAISLIAWSWVAVQVKQRGSSPLSSPCIRLSRSEWALCGMVLAILLTTGLLAILTPPQSWDSFNYRMSRVAHWAQDGSIRHFATGIEQQNSRPPMAEMAVLHGYVLTQSDRLANLPAWFSFVGCVIGAGLIAAWLGASRLGQGFAALFVATTPMAIVEASSTMNDIVAALWTLVVAAECLWLWKDGARASTWSFLGLAAGLGLLTKPIAVPYIAVFALLAVIGTLRRQLSLRALAPVALGGMLVLTLNTGHLARSMATYGSPLEASQVSVHANRLWDPRALVSNAIRNVSLHLGTPSGYVNKALVVSIEAIHAVMDLSPSDPRTTAHKDFEVKSPTKIETRVGNPLQMLLILAAGVVLIARRRTLGIQVVVFGAAAVAGFLLYSFLFKWQLFGSRYHLPFFILMAPVVSLALESFMSNRIVLVTGAVLTLACLPWLLSLEDRPLIATAASDVRSVLLERREKLYFANARVLATPIAEVSGRLLAAQCGHVGLALSGNSAEYLWWAMLGTPREDLQLEWLVSGTPSAVYRKEPFQPCAVICEGCPEGWDEVRGLPLAWKYGNIRLFMDPTGN